jgi:hypothetical protein
LKLTDLGADRYTLGNIGHPHGKLEATPRAVREGR